MLSVPSLGKILVLVAILALVWFAFRLVGRLDQARKQRASTPQGRSAKTEAGRPRQGVEETVKCRVCGAYVAARGATSCGRADCPY